MVYVRCNRIDSPLPHSSSEPCGGGPSRWLMAVVSYEQEPARIITALANRKDPKTWKP